MKLNNAGVRQWATYFGGAGTDYSNGVAIDQKGGVYLTGPTTSTNGISTTGSHQTTNSGNTDGYFAKLSAANGSLYYASYYGGTGNDICTGIACDTAGNFYLVGRTNSISGITTNGSYKPFLIGGLMDGLLAKFNNNGIRQWATYFGGIDDEDIMTDVEVTPAGIIYALGTTISNTGIATAGAYQSSRGGSSDMFLTEWTSNGILNWATYYGGHAGEGQYVFTTGGTGSPVVHTNCLSYTRAGYVYIGGRTLSTSKIATPGAHQTAYAGGQDFFLVQFALDSIASIKQPFKDTTFCRNDSLYVKYELTDTFRLGNVFTIQLSDDTGSFFNAVDIGSNTTANPDSIKCLIPANAVAGAGYRIRIISTAPARTSYSNGVNIRVKAGPENLLASSNSAVCVASTINLSANSTATLPVTWSWTGPNGFASTTKNPIINNANTTMAGDYILTAVADGCTTKDTATVVVKTLPATPVATNNGPICTGDTLKLFSAGSNAGVNYTWTGPGGFTSKQEDTLIANANIAQTGMYTVVAVKDGCTSATAGNTIAIVYPVTPAPIANSNTPICAGGTLYLTTNTVAATTYLWTGPLNFTATQQNPSIPFIAPQQAGNYVVTAYANGCASLLDTVTVVVQVASILGAYASPNDTICGGETVTLVATATNNGINPQYQWYKNNLPVATTPLMTDGNVANGDKYYCTMYSTSLCQMPITIATDTIKMTVHDVLVTPSVSITSVPVQPIPGQLANFTAVPVHPGYLPQYQWLRNGQKVIGAISANWSAGYLHPTDVISCMLISSDKCASVDTVYSNKIVVNFPTSVSSIKSNSNTISLYPNPNNGNFTITGNTDATGVAGIEIVNAVGQVVHRDNADISNNQINKQVSLNANSLANGVYLLKITANGTVSNLQFAISK